MADAYHGESCSSHDSPTPTPTPHRARHRSPSPSPRPRRPSSTTRTHSDATLAADSPPTTSAAAAAANAELFSASNTWDPPEPAPTPSVTFHDPPATGFYYERDPLPARAKSYPAVAASAAARSHSSALAENPWAMGGDGAAASSRARQQGSDASLDWLPGAAAAASWSSSAGSNGSGSGGSKTSWPRGRRPRGRPRTRYYSTASGGDVAVVEAGEEEALPGAGELDEADEDWDDEDDGQPLLVTRRRRTVPAPLLAVVLVVLLLMVVLVVFVVDRAV